MRSQNYLCVDLKTRTQNTLIQPGQMRQGLLSYIDEDHFEFDETLPVVRIRNPKLFQGEHISITRAKDGRNMINFRQMELNPNTNLLRLADEIFVELQAAAAQLN